MSSRHHASHRLWAAGAGGASRDRTDDLRVANATLSQLSYGPGLKHPAPLPGAKLWWVWEELHPRPHPYQGCALTN
jgi:hypothetical protein